MAKDNARGQCNGSKSKDGEMERDRRKHRNHGIGRWNSKEKAEKRNWQQVFVYGHLSQSSRSAIQQAKGSMVQLPVSFHSAIDQKQSARPGNGMVTEAGPLPRNLTYSSSALCTLFGTATS